MLKVDEIQNGVVIDHITACLLYTSPSPRDCSITSIEEGCDHIFALTPSGRYRCIYCEQEFRVKP